MKPPLFLLHKTTIKDYSNKSMFIYTRIYQFVINRWRFKDCKKIYIKILKIISHIDYNDFIDFKGSYFLLHFRKSLDVCEIDEKFQKQSELFDSKKFIL